MFALGRWSSTYDPIGRYSAGQGADVAVLEGALGAQGNLDRLFDVGGRTRRVLKGYVNDSEPDLGLG